MLDFSIFYSLMGRVPYPCTKPTSRDACSAPLDWRRCARKFEDVRDFLVGHVVEVIEVVEGVEAVVGEAEAAAEEAAVVTTITSPYPRYSFNCHVKIVTVPIAL